jgi:hypothetical protein
MSKKVIFRFLMIGLIWSVLFYWLWSVLFCIELNYFRIIPNNYSADNFNNINEPIVKTCGYETGIIVYLLTLIILGVAVLTGYKDKQNMVFTIVYFILLTVTFFAVLFVIASFLL